MRHGRGGAYPCAKGFWWFRRPGALICLGIFFFVAFPAKATLAAPRDEVAATERCPVCGMFVAKYPDWLGQIHLADGGIRFFDGVKDLLAFYHHPGEYGAGEASVKDIWVKDYYTLEWVDGRAAFYVIGSDIYGPMGHEFIPFASRPAAENFRKDHKGTDILSFAQITAELVRSLRTGQKMR